jgi:hypothetical protein
VLLRTNFYLRWYSKGLSSGVTLRTIFISGGTRGVDLEGFLENYFLSQVVLEGVVLEKYLENYCLSQVLLDGVTSRST